MIDLDGTLLDTARDLAEAANAMLRNFGLAERTPEAIRAFIGRGMANLVQRCLDGQIGAIPAQAEALTCFKDHYRKISGRHAVPYPGVVNGLRTLRGMGLPLACVTNKAGDFALPLLKHCGLADSFDLIVCGDTLPKIKPDPMPLWHVCEQFGVEPDQALMIGDSLNDVNAARAAGCPVFCLPYGYNEGQSVQELDCDAIVPSLEAVVALISAEACRGRMIHNECRARSR